MNGNSRNQEQYPKTAWGLIIYIAKMIPGRLLKALPMTILTSAAFWMLHTYLLVYVNQGFNPDTWLGKNLLNVQGHFLSSTILWTLTGALATMMLSSFRRGGNPVKKISSILKMPVTVLKKNRLTGGRVLPAVCFSCAFLLFMEKVLSGMAYTAAGVFVVTAAASFVTGRGSIFIQLLRMIINDIQTYVLKKKRFNFDNDSIFMIAGSSGIVMLLVGIMKALDYNPYNVKTALSYIVEYMWVVFVVSGVILFSAKKKIPGKLMLLLCITAAALFAAGMPGTAVFADDGGWQEAGGTFDSWIKSPGAIPAVLRGLPPAAAVLIGSFISSITAGISGSGFGQAIGMEAPVPPAEGTAPQPLTRILHERNGHEITIEYDPKTGQWHNVESGNIFDPDRFEEWQDNVEKDREFSRKEMEKMAARDGAFDKEMKEMVQRQKLQDKMLQNLQQMEKAVFFGSERAQSLYENRGGPGDIIEKIRELKESISDPSQFAETSKSYERVRNAYSDRIMGETTGESALPSDNDLLRETFSEGVSGTMKEIATGSSYKSMALRAILGLVTGGTSEIGYTSANALYGMKEYVDKGGDSAFEAFRQQVTQVLTDEVMNRIGDKLMDGAIDSGARAVSKTAESGGKAVNKAVDIFESRFKDVKKVVDAKKLTPDQKKELFVNKLKNSLAAADADNAGLISRAKASAVDGSTLAKRNEFFRQGRETGARKVSDIETSLKNMKNNPNSQEAINAFNNAVEAAQLDKHAMQQLNALKGPEGNTVRKAFNQRMDNVYYESLEKSRVRIAKEYGVPLDEVQIVNPTNVKGSSIPDAQPMGFAKGKVTTTSGLDEVEFTPRPSGMDDAIKADKVSFDKDLTIRVKQKGIDPRTGQEIEGFLDVPKGDTQRIYGEEFYKTNHNGELPRTPEGKIDTDAVNSYSKKMDQASTDRLDAEAYGIGDKDLQTSTMDVARGRKLDDAGAVSKTMEFKANEWANRADEARKEALEAAAKGDDKLASELMSEAEGFMEESMRQTTKQFDNMVINRIVEANKKAGFPDVPAAKIPVTLQKAIAVMKKVGKEGGITPAEAEKALKLMNLTPQQVAEMSSSVVESLQKLES